MRTLACRLLRLTLVPFLLRHVRQRRRLTILVYHDPEPETFAAHLAALRRRYSLVPLGAAVEACRAGRLDELPPRPLAITLDDGHRGNAALGDVLAEAEAPATIFICSDLVGTAQPFWFLTADDPQALKRLPDDERVRVLQATAGATAGPERHALTWTEVRELRRVVEFGSHTRSHPILPRCPAEKAWDETAGSREDLEAALGEPVVLFAYPNGDHSGRDVRFAREAGYRGAVVVGGGLNADGADPFRLRRIPIGDADSVDVALVKACGLWGAVRRAVLGRRA